MAAPKSRKLSVRVFEPCVCKSICTVCADRLPPGHALKPGASWSGRQRAQHVEFVAFGIGHDDPADLGALSDVNAAGAQPLEPCHLGGLVFGPQVEVDAVLDHFLLFYQSPTNI